MPSASYFGGRVLDYQVGKTAMPTLPVAYIALFTVIGARDGTGFTECTVARLATAGSDWNAASGAPRANSNATALTMATPTPGSPETAIGWGLYDAATTGNLLFYDYLGNNQWIPFSCTSASPGVITAPQHGLSNGDKIVMTADFGGVLPTTAGSFAGLLTVAGVSGDTFNVGVNSTASGEGSFRKVDSKSIVNGSTVTFAIGAITMKHA